eukprot:TRINITY_DN16004_c0_g1_i1.p1 TRINITY_DN16004_c0_g1~~TRINITY_DN16004_c0_g1_i1.p1  ORF type:complete len:259 (+),score=31.55 TRINITY_DN16004_c0_g1_i1:32-778(+)
MRESRKAPWKGGGGAVLSPGFTFTVHHLVERNSVTSPIIHNFSEDSPWFEGYFLKVFSFLPQPAAEFLLRDFGNFENFTFQSSDKAPQGGAGRAFKDPHALLPREKEPFSGGFPESGLPEKTLFLKLLSMEGSLGLQRKEFRKVLQPGKAEAFEKIHGLGRGDPLSGVAVEMQELSHPEGVFLGPAPSSEKGEGCLTHLPVFFLSGGSKKIQKKSPGGAGEGVSSPAASRKERKPPPLLGGESPCTLR